MSVRAAASALLVLLCIAAFPGLTGSWVYDDLGMVGHPAYDSLDDVLRVPWQDSSVYMTKPGADKPTGDRAYRPTTMLTLVGTHALRPSPLAHHMVGFALHLLMVWLVYLALRAKAPRTAGFLAAIMALHPAVVEAWVWIHGRSDLVAGVLLAALAVALGRQRIAWPWVGLLGLLGAGAKEPFLLAAAALAAAHVVSVWDQRAERSQALARALALVAGMALLWLARAALVPMRASFASGTSAALDTDLLRTFGKTLLLACDHLLLFRSEPMEMLASLTVRGPTAVEIATGVAGAMLLLAMLRARDVRGVVLVLGALATLAPTVLVSRALWLGFDRYLYMPLMLLLLALGPHLERAIERGYVQRRLVATAGYGLVVVSAFLTWTAATRYANNAVFHHSMLTERAGEPAVFAYEAFTFRDQRPQLAYAILADFPKPPWPEAAVVPLMVVARALGDEAWVDRVLAYGEAHFKNNPLLRAHAMSRHYERGEDGSAARLALRFEAGDVVCPEVARQVASWARTSPEPRRGVWQRVQPQLRCHPGP